MNSQREEELKPCPFCGSSNIAAFADVVLCGDCNAQIVEIGQGSGFKDARDLWNTRQAATEQGVATVSNPDLCPICKDRQVIPDEDWCGACRAEFYDSVMEEDTSDAPTEQGAGEAFGRFDGWAGGSDGRYQLSVFMDSDVTLLERGAKLYTHPPKPTGGGVPEGWKLVPIEPTLRMLDAGEMARVSLEHPSMAAAIYKAMILATQQPPEQE